MSDIVAAWCLILYDVIRATLENQPLFKCQSNSRGNWSQHRSKLLYESFLLLMQLKSEKNIHCEWMTLLYQSPCSHVQTLCTPLKIHPTPDLLMCSTPFGSCSQANGSRVGTTANSGQCIFKIEPENKVNVLIFKSSIYICHCTILLWGGFVYFSP